MATFNFQLANKLKHFREAGDGRDARLPVLLYLKLRANIRLRCWPSVQTIATDIGLGKPRVIEALHWLTERGALYVVPVNKRVGKEQYLRRNRHVYQLTGIIFLNGQPCEYLYLSDETRQEVDEELQRLGANEILARLRGSETEPTNGTDSEPTETTDGSESEPIHGTETEPETPSNGSVNGPIELYTIENISSEQVSISAPHGANTETPPTQTEVLDTKQPSQSLFNTICRRGFKLDPQRLPTNPRTGKTYDGGRIGKLRREMLDLYPDLTPPQLEAMYNAYYRALPDVQYLKSIPRTLEYLVEFMQTGTIQPPIARRDKHQTKHSLSDFRDPQNASAIYLQDELHQLDLPTGYCAWLDEHYWTRAPGNGISGADLVRGLQLFQRGA